MEALSETIIDPKKIKLFLPSDYGTKLSQRTGKSRRWIYSVVNAGDENDPLWSDILELAEEHVAKRKSNRVRLANIYQYAAIQNQK